MWSAYSQDGEPDPEFHRRMSANSTGVSFHLAFRIRSPLEPAHRGLSDLVFGHGPSSGRFLLGVGLADGRRATNVLGRDTDDGIVFHAGGGGGGELSVDQSWWLHPLPPVGPLRFVVGCAALGIDETSPVVDGALIRRAAADVVTLWPWGPPTHDPTRPPALPAPSWLSEPS